MKIKWLIVGVFTAIVVSVLIFPNYFMPQPPLAELTEARESLSLAEKSQASIYSEKQFQKASALYDSAMASWREENKRFFFTKDYSKTKEFATRSAELSRKAEKNAKSSYKTVWANFSGRLKMLETQLSLFDQTYKNIPLSKSMVKLLAETRLLHQASKNALVNKNGKLMVQNLTTLEKDVNTLTSFVEKSLKNFFVDYPLWKKWEANAIAASKRNGSSAIIVDKLERKCYIYNKGKLVSSFNMELGANWMGDKQRSGDKTTPEGIYKVVKRKSKGQTKYYKALLLNYPNEDDKKRFKANKENGLIPQNATIGNLIEIHGDGGKGIDWTDGCVALTNNDMDKIFDMSAENTPVIIVGALKLSSIEQ
jgi:L,D-peptidoglycan transpeptidase YkuD (ErfK/YbiS/YcfS/YnhG family)